MDNLEFDIAVLQELPEIEAVELGRRRCYGGGGGGNSNNCLISLQLLNNQGNGNSLIRIG